MDFFKPIYAFIFCCLLFQSACKTSKTARVYETTSTDYLKNSNSIEIIFDDHFNNDTISVIAENQLLFENEIVTSHETKGTTGFNFFIVKEDLNNYSIISDRRNSLLDTLKLAHSLNDAFNLDVIVNDKRNNHNINIEKGNYVFVSKAEKCSLSIIQHYQSYSY